jgi:hypothetical protein
MFSIGLKLADSLRSVSRRPQTVDETETGKETNVKNKGIYTIAGCLLMAGAVLVGFRQWGGNPDATQGQIGQRSVYRESPVGATGG